MAESPYGPQIMAQPPPRAVSLKPSFHLDFSALASRSPNPIKPVSLSEIRDVSTQQALVIKDMLLALLGCEGHYVRFSERYSGESLGDRIRGPDFKVAAPLDISLKNVTKKLLRYGKYYSGLCNFAQIYNMSHFGRVNQRLCGEVARELSRFRSLVLSLEHSFQNNTHFTLSAMDNEIHNTCGDNLKHLYEIVGAVHADTEARNAKFVSATDVSSAISGDFLGTDPKFNAFLDSIRTEVSLGASVSSDPNAFDVCKGGLVLKIVENRMAQHKGDQKSMSFLLALFEAISVDYVASLNTWLSEGEVDDQFQEFLVKKNELPKIIFYSDVERYWEELYVIKVDGLIGQFRAKDAQAQVLATGKFLNIFRRCVGCASLRDFPEDVSTVACPENITSLFAQDLAFKISQFYDRANNLLLKTLFRGYHFSDMLTCLHETYLLCESSKVDVFFDKTLGELGKNKAAASTLTLIDTFNDVFSLGESRTYHTSQASQASQTPQTQSTHARISALLRTLQKFSIDSNNFYDLSEEIINHRSFDANSVTGDEQASSAVRKLVSRSLRQQSASSENEPEEPDKESVIAAVNIDCELPFPINLMISENYMFEFQLVFKLQMILKYTSKLIDASWRDSMYSTVWNYRHFSEPLRKLILRSRVLIFRMKNFVTELQNYVDHFVIGYSYGSLRESINNLVVSLDKPRPASRTTRSCSPFKDAQPLAHATKNNSIFDEKIKITSSKQHASDAFGDDPARYDVHGLSSSIGTYLSKILRDSMITNSRLLEHLRSSLAVVTEFTSITSRLKKTLISTDAALLEAFARDYPGRFDNIEFSERMVRSRIAGLNNVITKFWTEFNAGLQTFTQDLRTASTENASFMALRDKLATI